MDLHIIERVDVAIGTPIDPFPDDSLEVCSVVRALSVDKLVECVRKAT
ncbi:hypothetical protein [Haloarcula pelagica]